MKTIKISREDIQGAFIVPPENGGQIVTTSYACTGDYILARTSDASDRSEEIVAYRWPASGEFEPQNGSPKLGRRVGAVRINQEVAA